MTDRYVIDLANSERIVTPIGQSFTSTHCSPVGPVPVMIRNVEELPIGSVIRVRRTWGRLTAVEHSLLGLYAHGSLGLMLSRPARLGASLRAGKRQETVRRTVPVGHTVEVVSCMRCAVQIATKSGGPAHAPSAACRMPVRRSHCSCSGCW